MLDAFSRRIVGWSVATHMRTELVLDALRMAIEQRKPVDMIHHSVQGGQYTTVEFGQRRGNDPPFRLTDRHSS
ncbi:MAG: DDE-type integrase/transposase/recombinase [Myxococcales bacterium]|nr:DDE-type integrase/transposase/recombinase [Myxococcales bacterium]